MNPVIASDRVFEIDCLTVFMGNDGSPIAVASGSLTDLTATPDSAIGSCPRASDRTARPLVEGITTHMRYLRWSPDGTRISYFDESGVYVVYAATGDATRIASGAAPERLDDHTLIFERG
ncbi:MAG: hypothetical protein ACRDG8_09995 [Actinomycetota bacterium]